MRLQFFYSSSHSKEQRLLRVYTYKWLFVSSQFIIVHFFIYFYYHYIFLGNGMRSMKPYACTGYFGRRKNPSSYFSKVYAKHHMIFMHDQNILKYSHSFVGFAHNLSLSFSRSLSVFVRTLWIFKMIISLLCLSR